MRWLWSSGMEHGDVCGLVWACCCLCCLHCAGVDELVLLLLLSSRRHRHCPPVIVIIVLPSSLSRCGICHGYGGSVVFIVLASSSSLCWCHHPIIASSPLLLCRWQQCRRLGHHHAAGAGCGGDGDHSGVGHMCVGRTCKKKLLTK